MEENFKDHPQTVGEIKAEKTWNAADWTPRDVLINTLRDIDNGKINTTTLIVCYELANTHEVTYAVSSPFLSATLGLLSRVKNRLLTQDVL